MAGDSTTPDGAGATDDDPRCSPEYVRVVDGEATGAAGGRDRGSIALVGVVHDHPASVYRVQEVLSSRAPDVLALELPPLAVPLFEHYAEADGEGDGAAGVGGEMSAAIRAADAETTVGIDGPTPAFGLRLARHLVAARASLGTVRTALGRFARASGHALRCRLAAAVADADGADPALSAPRTHAVTPGDPAAKQARDEHRQVRLARSVAAAFGANRAVATRDETREAHMAERIETLAADGDLVAVIGVDHLGAVAEHLEGGCGS